MFFPGGETTFILGKSGSGKSTISNLLIRLYNPEKGRLFIDDNDIQLLDTSWLRNNITLVDQQCVLFSETIFRNISLGRPHPHRVTHAQIGPSLRIASLKGMISSLPNGVETRVGSGGSSLSGGQKQRLAIARAHLRDTPVLILDEATSALDNQTRVAVMDSIRSWRQQKTTIIITHDLSQVRDDDFVYVLGKGRIVEEGRRKDLVTLKPYMAIEDAPLSSLLDLDGDTGLDSANDLKHHSLSKSKFNALQTPLIRRHGAEEAEVEPPLDALFPLTRNMTSRSSYFRQRLEKGISISAKAVIHILQRQSIAHTKAIHIGGHQPMIDDDLLSAWRDMVSQDKQNTYELTAQGKAYLVDKPLPLPPPRQDIMLSEQPGSDDATPLDTPELGSKQRSLLDILMTVWPALPNTARAQLIGGFLAAFCHAGTPPLFSYLLVQVFGTFYLPMGYREKALKYTMSILVLAILDGIACFCMELFLHSASQSWVDRLRIQAMKKVLRQPKGWFDEERNSGVILVSCLDRNAEDMKALVARFAAQILVVAAMMLVAVSWSFATSWKLTAVALAASPVLYLLTKTFETTSSRWETKTNTAEEIVGEIFVDTFTDIKTIRAFTLESYFHQKFCSAIKDARSIGRRRALISGILYGLSDSAIQFFTPMIFWYGAVLVKHNEWPVKSVLIVISLLLFCTANANGVVAQIPEISSSADTANRLLRLANMEVVSHEETGHLVLNRDDAGTLSGPIHFINQTFFYPTRPEVPALKNLNLTIPSGNCTAVVGASGSGKSTLTSLLLGLYPSSPVNFPTGPPSLTVSGHDIRSLDLKTLRSLIAIVPQTPALIPTTVRENITYGLAPDSTFISASQIEWAARAAGIHEFIQSLPQGYATVIGDGGLGVSGGQAQRIVIARALLRDPRILILDEATSALDHESAEIIRVSIKSLLQKKKTKLTVIMVTHAADMMSFADHVAVLDEGSLVEEGPFTELLSKRGRLWKMLQSGEAVKKDMPMSTERSTEQ